MHQISEHLKDHLEMSEKIHSGQFMISKYDEESDNEDIRQDEPNNKGYNFDSSSLNKNFQFVERGQSEHKLEIDESLNTMFQYLSIAMSGKITNPKWNSFKGVKFQPKDKIRLNNIIWREYHMQFVKKLNPVVVQFASPLSDILQINGNVVLEGKYWKRRIDIIVHQYKKWREFYKNRFTYHYEDNKKTALFDSILVQRNLFQKMYSNSPPPNLNDIFMDLDDLNLPIDDITGVQHNCQIIQPQLTNLQPRMESSIDFLNDYFCAPHKTLDSQKLFSSETCLNVKPREIYRPKNEFAPNQSVKYSEESLTGESIDIDHVVTSSQINKRKLNGKLPGQYQLKPYHQQIKSNPSGLGICKTPNLLSILLQPISSTKSAASHQSNTCESEIRDILNKQPLVVSSNKYIGFHGPLEIASNSSTSSAQYELNKDVDLNSYKSQHLNYPKQALLNQNYVKSVPNSVFNQSVRMKHSLTANNLVQQYLEELSTLLISTRDHNKISKASLLHKASEHIKRLRIEKQRLQAEIVALQSEIDSMQNRFSAFCSELPATGVCVNNNNSSEGKTWFENFVIKNSLTNWKFYIFSMMFESLFDVYNNSVSTLSMDTLAHTVASWLEKECSLMKLRLIVINGMRTLSRKTSIVHNPNRLRDEVRCLIEVQTPSENRPNTLKWLEFQSKDRSLIRQSSQTKPIRYKSAGNSWPLMLNPEFKTSSFIDDPNQ